MEPLFGPKTEAFTSRHCEKHNTFYTIPGGRCEQCWKQLEEHFTGVIEKTAAQESSTGSLRFNSNKPQTNEISPKFLLDMGAVLEKARSKYPRGNWEKGIEYSVPWDSMMRHLLSWQQGERYDKESGLSHLAHAALNLMMLHYYEENYPEFDDRIFKKEKK